MLIPVLLFVSFGIASLLPTEFVAVLAVYYVLTMSYSLRLKRAALIDVLVLAGLYTIRILYYVIHPLKKSMVMIRKKT